MPTSATWTKCGEYWRSPSSSGLPDGVRSRISKRSKIPCGTRRDDSGGRLEACIEADIRFHVALAEATHNEILYELYRSATIHLQKVSNTFTSIRAIFSHRSLRTNGWYGI
ncbi:MAG: FCD domain-containing protein [Alistipes sp.]